MAKKPAAFYLIFPLTLSIFSISANAQYYYKDIWNNLQLVKEFNILKNANFKTIQLKSFEDDDQPSDGFFCEKKINKNYTQSQMMSKSNVTGQSLLVSDYNANGQPVKTTDDTPTTTSTTEYEYDQNGQLKLLRTTTKADDDSGEIIETHEYFYDEKGKPLKMLRKKGNMLVSTIHFVSDSQSVILSKKMLKATILLIRNIIIITMIKTGLQMWFILMRGPNACFPTICMNITHKTYQCK